METQSTQRIVEPQARPPAPAEPAASPRQPHSGKPGASPDSINMGAAAEQMQALADEHDINLDFSVHKATGRTVIRIVDAETNKVVRELPPEEILNLVASLEKLAGHLLNTEA